MEGIDLTQIFTTVGSVVGTPAAIFLFWIYSKLKELQNKVDTLEKENNSVQQTMTQIRSDVSFIRGKIEGLDYGTNT